jgi:hypothetical protein
MILLEIQEPVPEKPSTLIRVVLEGIQYQRIGKTVRLRVFSGCGNYLLHLQGKLISLEGTLGD